MTPITDAKRPNGRDVALLWRVIFLVAFALLNLWGHWTQLIAIAMAALSALSAVLLFRRSRFTPFPLYAITIYFLCATVIDGIYMYAHNPALSQQPIIAQMFSWLPAAVIAALLINCSLYVWFPAHGRAFAQYSKAADTARALIGRIAGGVLLTFGIGLSILAVWIVERQFVLRRGLHVDTAAMVVGFSLIAVFCFYIGYRLFFQRPNRYKSILSPSGWMWLAASLIAIGLGIGAVAIWRGTYQLLTLPAVLGVLASICAIASRAAKRGSMKPDDEDG